MVVCERKDEHKGVIENMKNHYCSNPLCLARVEKKDELCEECKTEKE
jgi:hypothetical protein